jgi:hypothetical protein
MIIIFVSIIFILPSILFADEVQDSINAKVDTLFMQASSGEVQFRDLVEPAKEELINMGEKAVPQMITKLRTEDARERHTVEDIFKGIGDPAVPYLIEALNTDNLYQLRLAATCLGKIGNKAATEPLIKLFNYSDYTVQAAAVTAVGEIKDTAAVNDIIGKLDSKYENVGKSAAVALGRIGQVSAIDPLIEALDYPYYSVRYTASQSLVQLGDKSGGALLDDFDNLPPIASYYAPDIWAGLKYKEALNRLEDLTKSDDGYMRGFAIVAIAKIDPKKAEKIIRKNRQRETNLFVLSSFDMAQKIIDNPEE